MTTLKFSSTWREIDRKKYEIIEKKEKKKRRREYDSNTAISPFIQLAAQNSYAAKIKDPISRYYSY